MKILVAGGAGYVGSELVPQLEDRGYEVEVVDLLWFGNHLPEGVRVTQGDIIDLTVHDLRGFDQVVFLGGLSNDPMADYSPATNFVANAACPAFLAYIAKEAGVRRFIYAGSCSVYGYSVDELFTEESPTISRFPYGISKLQGEHGVMGMTGDDFSVISLRKGTICGYSRRMRFDLVINTMFMTALKEKTIRVNNPSIWRPILSMKDAVSGYIRSIEADEGISGIFNLASDNFTIGALGDLVREGVEQHLGLDVKTEILAMRDLRNYKVSIEKAERVLGFSPAQSVQDIIAELAAHRDEYGDFSKPEFYNIERFEKLEL